MQKPVYFRRCHVCGTINHSDDTPVERCFHCGKYLCRFFYFDDRLISIVEDSALRPLQYAGEYLPLQGISVYWD
ncbi:MAG: hypothetical protein KDD35_10560 [Bdellovibrionales bacterium]|nr:hypothetical protein [Bdellovibrionales bacterium]